MLKLTLTQIAHIIGGELIHATNDDACVGITFDTRTMQKDNLYFAILGENLDGHQFVADAKNKGAIGAVVQQEVIKDFPQIVVKDTTKALGQLGQYWREQFHIPIVAVTGSNGKTSTKNMLQAIFIAATNNPEEVLATQGNFNNHWGLPLTLARLNAEHRFAVIEMGMNHFGELDYLTHLTKPTAALITNAAPAHLAGVGGTIEGVAKAKGEIYSGLTNEGIAIINADDAFADYWRSLNTNRKQLTFGIDKPSDVKGVLIKNGFQLQYKNQTIDIHLSLPGKHNVMNALAASAAALANHVELSVIKKALENLLPTAGRLQSKKGREGINIIDDTYNANPSSLKAAIEVLATYPGKRILVLGDMRELGEAGSELHKISGEFARQLNIDYLFAVGDLMQFAVNAFGKNAFHFANHQELINALENCLSPETTVLVKGSRSMKMEQVVKALMISDKQG